MKLGLTGTTGKSRLSISFLAAGKVSSDGILILSIISTKRGSVEIVLETPNGEMSSTTSWDIRSGCKKKIITTIKSSTQQPYMSQDKDQMLRESDINCISSFNFQK